MFPMRRKPKKPTLDAMKPGDPIEARDGTRYTVDNVIVDGNKVHHSMTLERETPKRDKSMSPRQWRNKRKAERRLERERRQRRLEASRVLDETAAHDGADVVVIQTAGRVDGVDYVDEVEIPIERSAS